MVRIVALLVVLTLAAVPAAALAAAPVQPGSQEQPLLQNQAAPVPQDQAPAPTPAPTRDQADDGSIGSGQMLLIGLGIAALIGGIWVVIARDARRATAGRRHAHAAGVDSGAGRGGSATRSARRTRKLSAAERQRRKRGRAS